MAGEMKRGTVAAWVRLDTRFAWDAKVRKARASAVWPLVLAKLKCGNGFASDDDMDPEILAEELFVPVEVCVAAIAGLKRVGLLVMGEADVLLGGRLKTVRHLSGWTTPGWTDYQPDPRDRGDRREEMQSGGPLPVPAEAIGSQGTDGNQHAEATVPRDPMSRYETIRDETGEQQQPPVAIATVPPSQGGHGVEPVPEAVAVGQDPEPEAAPLPATPKLTARQRQALDLHAMWVAASGATGARASAAKGVGKKRISTIAARLADGFSAEDVAKVIRAGLSSEWHVRTGNTAPEFTCRADQFDRLLTASNARASPPAVASVNEGWSSRVALATAQAKADEDKHAALDELPF